MYPYSTFLFSFLREILPFLYEGDSSTCAPYASLLSLLVLGFILGSVCLLRLRGHS